MKFFLSLLQVSKFYPSLNFLLPLLFDFPLFDIFHLLALILNKHKLIFKLCKALKKKKRNTRVSSLFPRF